MLRRFVRPNQNVVNNFMSCKTSYGARRFVAPIAGSDPGVLNHSLNGSVLPSFPDLLIGVFDLLQFGSLLDVVGNAADLVVAKVEGLEFRKFYEHLPRELLESRIDEVKDLEPWQFAQKLELFRDVFVLRPEGTAHPQLPQPSELGQFRGEVLQAAVADVQNFQILEFADALEIAEEFIAVQL